MPRKLFRFCAVVVLSTISSTTLAVAASGTFTREPGRVNFFYGKSGGNADGTHVSGLDDGEVCGNVPGSSSSTMFVMEFKQDKRLFPDPLIDTASARYSDGVRCTEDWALSTSSKYYPVATWNYYSGDGTNAKGYAKIS